MFAVHSQLLFLELPILHLSFIYAVSEIMLFLVVLFTNVLEITVLLHKILQVNDNFHEICDLQLNKYD